MEPPISQGVQAVPGTQAQENTKGGPQSVQAHIRELSAPTGDKPLDQLVTGGRQNAEYEGEPGGPAGIPAGYPQGGA